MRKADVQVGMRVTCKVSVPAWNEYGRYPCTFEPGDIGTVVSVDVPSVTHNRSFVNVDFTKDGAVRRVSLLYPNIARVPGRKG